MLAGSSREALSKWEDAWCDAMLEVLASSEPRLSANVSTYALSVPLAMESGSLITLLQRILAAVKMSDGTVPDGQVSISWHAGRQMASACACSVPQGSALTSALQPCTLRSFLLASSICSIPHRHIRSTCKS